MAALLIAAPGIVLKNEPVAAVEVQPIDAPLAEEYPGAEEAPETEPEAAEGDLE